MIVPKLPRNLSPLNVLTICLIKACYLTDKKRKKQCMLSNRLQVEIYLWAYPYCPSPSNFTTIHKARSNFIQISNLCYAVEVLPNINNESQLNSEPPCAKLLPLSTYTAISVESEISRYMWKWYTIKCCQRSSLLTFSKCFRCYSCRSINMQRRECPRNHSSSHKYRSIQWALTIK